MGFEQKIDTAIGASVLEWWREAGVDTLIDEAPRNWLAAEAAPAPAPVRPAPTARSDVPAPAALDFPDTLPAFEAWRLGDAAPEARWPGVRVGAQGKADGGLMVLLEMPERDDTPDRLLGGAPGALFDRMLAAMGQSRPAIYLAPMAVVRPISGRIPVEAEPSLAKLIRAQVALAAPKALLILGNAASRALLGTDVARARGHLHVINHQGGKGSVTAVASFHPRFLLERPAAKAEAWKDLQLLIGGLS